jgi:hypothetical protein
MIYEFANKISGTLFPQPRSQYMLSPTSIATSVKVGHNAQLA